MIAWIRAILARRKVARECSETGEPVRDVEVWANALDAYIRTEMRRPELADQILGGTDLLNATASGRTKAEIGLQTSIVLHRLGGVLGTEA